ncbi:hypothetical protein [Methanobrevibacter sp.]|uniref:hypothetical protein n=1 Tax=Methanobrevibacter sp. TaxID=66852 RepID=UPI002E767DCA|nr:hypothetical protein [Methanobrevibacter sp.]MEE1336562.1 hypothetical protein [Methanobrevibacter sp.]
MKKSYILILCLILAILSVSAVSAGLLGDNNDKLTVEDLKISDEGYGMYDVTCNLKADKEFSYLEMVVVFYDDSGAIIEKSPLVWNMNDVPKDQTIKVSGSAFINGDNTPSKAEVYIFDDSLSSDLDNAIYKESVDM